MLIHTTRGAERLRPVWHILLVLTNFPSRAICMKDGGFSPLRSM